MEYAFEHHFWGNKGYNPDYSASYENFIMKYGTSIYADYAILDMYKEIYYYPNVTEDQREQKFKEYGNFFSLLKRKNVQAGYLRLLPVFFNKKLKGDMGSLKADLDAFLKEIKSQSPSLSKIIIKAAEKDFKLTGLKNYAEDKH